MRFLLFILLLLTPHALASTSFEPDLQIVEVRFSGLERTSPSWIESYLGLELPVRLTRPDIVRIQRKLLTTGVFTDVKAAVEPRDDKLDTYTLWLQVEEKWTTIPVVRGVYGGGTPLRVLGVYDIHAFGRLLTLGGEARKYGDAPPGFILYGRDPRNQGGRNYFGAEYWREFRRRQVFDKDETVRGTLGTDVSISKIKLSTPFTRDKTPRASFSWRYGLDFELLRDNPTSFEPVYDYAGDSTVPTDMGDLSRKHSQSRLLATILYDDVEINQLEEDGLRAKLRVGPNITSGRSHSLAELEAFYYRMLPLDINFASHVFFGQSTLNEVSSLYFLGGFDSVRGLPDGIAYGTRSGFLNLELRHVSLKQKYVWLQPVLFADAGNAGSEWRILRDDIRSSAGAGLRIAIPQVYRLIFRIDYAVSTDGSGSRGITAGMNQFFDPYRPL